jgi:hypothetical protein
MDWVPKEAAAEWAVDAGAAAIFAAAVGFAMWAVVAAGPANVGAIGAVAFLLVGTALRQVPVEEPSYVLPNFQPAPIEAVAGRPPETAGELLLDDRLIAVEPDARVVRLFDPSRMPSVDDSSAAAPDASQALSDALAQLRRSLH